VRLLLTMILLLLASCASRPPVSTAPDTARADEQIRSHENEQAADIEAAREAATLLNIPGVVVALDRIKGRLSAFTAAISKLIATIEAKAELLEADNARLRSEKYAALYWLVIVGVVVAAVGAGLLFTPLGKLTGVGGIVCGISLSLFAVAIIETIWWVKVLAPIGLAVAIGLAVFEIWRNWKSFLQVVKVTEIAKRKMPASLRTELFDSKGSIANGVQSGVTRRLVDAAQGKIQVREPPST